MMFVLAGLDTGQTSGRDWLHIALPVAPNVCPTHTAARTLEF